MEVNETTPEVTATPEVPAVDPAPAVPTPDAAPPQIDPTTGQPVAAKPAYSPNYKFKAFNQEKEFDELFRPVVKDGDTEKKVREFHEKYHAFDGLKSERDRIKNEYKEVKTQYETLDKSLTQLSKFVQNGDLDSFFKGIKLPDSMILQYAVKKLREMELPPEQQQELRRQSEERQRLYQLEQQNADLQQRFGDNQVQARTYQLDTALEKPDVRQFASMFDSKRGEGSFRRAVLKHGFIVEKSEGVDLTPEQAISAVMEDLRPFMQTTAAQPQQSSVGMQTPPVIPAVSGKGTSPVKAKFKSLKELREYGKNM